MLSFDNSHIFTGHLKQLLASVNLPTCKIYTQEFASHLARTGKEDPRVVESFGALGASRPMTTVNYLKNGEICTLYYNFNTGKAQWQFKRVFCYDKDNTAHGITRKLSNFGPTYDTTTHEYLGDFLRFLRDYYNINLMSLYNCFNNKVYKNIDFKLTVDSSTNTTTAARVNTKTNNTTEHTNKKVVAFNSNDPNFRIYAFPVKLFSNYTIALDCNKGIEMFCGLYRKSLDGSEKCINLFNKTYQKVDRAMFNKPFVYDKLSYKYWSLDRELSTVEKNNGKESVILIEDTSSISRYDLINREQDLKLFIKVPTTCSSSITVLEGDFSCYNDCKYIPCGESGTGKWEYRTNSSIINFDNNNNLNSFNFKPISRVQLLAFNTGESYPFADRLIEYLSGSVITPIDGIADNIKRAQKVMSQNNHYFRTDGVWEDKMQKIAYDYIMNSGPIEFNKELGKLVDKRQGLHPRVGHRLKNNLYDILGYIDKDTEKYYASWKNDDDKAKVINSIQNVDIYNGLFDI